MLTEAQKRAAQGIVNVFETGKIAGDYGAIAVIPGDTGHLSYGRSQVTLGSGSLAKLLDRYCADPKALQRGALVHYLKATAAKDFALDNDPTFKALLKQAGLDPVMRAVQDAFFDEGWWNPAVAACAKLGFTTALGTAVVYDSHIQGSWPIVRDLTSTALGGVLTEKPWIARYVNTRWNWLATHKITALHATVYRMQTFEDLIVGDCWDLALPFTITPGKMKPRVLDVASLGLTGSA